MTREEAIDLLDNLNGMIEDSRNSDYDTAFKMAIKALEQEPCEITLEDVKEYCKPRCLTIITDELLYELTHTKIKALEQEPILDKIRAEIEQMNNLDYVEPVTVHEILQIIDKYKAESEE